MSILQLLYFISPLAKFKLVQFSNVLELFCPFSPIMLEILKKKPAYLQIIWLSSNNINCYICIIHAFENGILLAATHTDSLFHTAMGNKRIKERLGVKPKLTLYTLTSVFIFSILFSVHFLRVLTRRILSNNQEFL